MSRTIRHKASPIPFPVRVPFVESLGIELHGYSTGHAELRVDLDEAHLNAWEVAHGGVVMTLLDVAMAMVARSMTGHAGGVATVEMKTSFFRPAEHQLRAVAKVLHHTSTLVFCEVRARRTAAGGGAGASVGLAKQRSLVFAAQHYLMRLRTLPACRFDVVAIDGERMEWLQGAFQA